MASGVSTGALVRIGRSAGPRRTKERTSEPFFSDPYEEKCAPFSPILSTAALASTCPAAWAPKPPIDSNRISNDRRELGNATAWFTAFTRYRGDGTGTSTGTPGPFSLASTKACIFAI